MQHFLVPLDGSALAEQALPYAKELASRLDGTICLVRVVVIARQLVTASMAGSGGMETMGGVGMEAIDQAIDAENKDAREYLTKQCQTLQQLGLRVEWEVRQGNPPDEISAAAKDHKTDVIVITTHGRSGLGRVVFGSVCDRIIRESGVPVLVINPK